MRSIEEEFQFELAMKLKSVRNINGIDYQWPKFTNTVTTVGFHEAEYSPGQFNRNLETEVIIFTLNNYYFGLENLITAITSNQYFGI